VLQSQDQNDNPTPFADAEREAVLAEMIALSEVNGTAPEYDFDAAERASTPPAPTSRPDARPILCVVS